MIFNFMEINILISCFPALERSVTDERGKKMLDDNGFPKKEKIPEKDLVFKPRYHVLNEIYRLKMNTEDIVLKTYAQSLWDKVSSISDEDLRRIEKDYVSGNLIPTERYILI